METRNIETLIPDPNNNHEATGKARGMLIYQMRMGNHSTFLITPEGMIIDGNNRWNLRNEVGWENKDIACKILTYGQDDQGFYAIIDGEIVKEAEVIPYHYVSLDALYKAYAFSRNGEAGYYDPDYIANNFDQWKLDPQKFSINLFQVKSLEDTLQALGKAEAKKKYEIVIPFTDAESATAAHESIKAQYITAKLKI